MSFVEVSFNIEPLEPARDILIAELSEIGYESFVEDDEGLKAYIVEDAFKLHDINLLYVLKSPITKIEYSHRIVPDKNWNAEWEKEYEPILIEKQLRVRASFHKPEDEYDHEIIIDPRMSFGTGHHATTRLMLSDALGKDLQGKSVLDMGCGTAVIAILAKKLGAGQVLAIDIDQNSMDNARDNVDLNSVEIDVQKGGAERLKGLKFDVIFANINRNVLLDDMPIYVEALNAGGSLSISGFYKDDIPVLKEKAKACGTEFVKQKKEEEWCMLEFKKDPVH